MKKALILLSIFITFPLLAFSFNTDYDYLVKFKGHNDFLGAPVDGILKISYVIDNHSGTLETLRFKGVSPFELPKSCKNTNGDLNTPAFIYDTLLSKEVLKETFGIVKDADVPTRIFLEGRVVGVNKVEGTIKFQFEDEYLSQFEEYLITPLKGEFSYNF